MPTGLVRVDTSMPTVFDSITPTSNSISPLRINTTDFVRVISGSYTGLVPQTSTSLGIFDSLYLIDPVSNTYRRLDTTSTWLQFTSTSPCTLPIIQYGELGIPSSSIVPRKFVDPIRNPKRSTRSSIKRALSLMTNMGFEEEAKIFLNGDTIEVSHPDSLLKFVISKYPRSIIARTEYPGISTPYNLKLYTKTDIFVANLCVYMEKTPLLDQVLGLAMFIKTGSEELILKRANWSYITRDMELKELLIMECPYLESKLFRN